jgi:hypothetical protein
MSYTTIRDIVKACGGPHRLAEESTRSDRPISEKGVYSWHRIGISDWHWPLVMRLSGVTERDLLAANEALRRGGSQDSNGRAA